MESLQKHIKVDVYGDCGSLKCDPRTPEDCYQMLNQSYKFYLSLENSVCLVGFIYTDFGSSLSPRTTSRRNSSSSSPTT